MLQEEFYKKALAKIIITLKSAHHGCNEEAVNIALSCFNVEVCHNEVREMINEVSDEEVNKLLAKLDKPTIEL